MRVAIWISDLPLYLENVTSVDTFDGRRLMQSEDSSGTRNALFVAPEVKFMLVTDSDPLNDVEQIRAALLEQRRRN